MCPPVNTCALATDVNQTESAETGGARLVQAKKKRVVSHELLDVTAEGARACPVVARKGCAERAVGLLEDRPVAPVP